MFIFRNIRCTDCGNKTANVHVNKSSIGAEMRDRGYSKLDSAPGSKRAAGADLVQKLAVLDMSSTHPN